MVEMLAVRMTTTMMMMLTMTSVMTSYTHTMMTSQHPLTFTPIYTPNGSRLCAVVDPFVPLHVFAADTLTSCALGALSSQAVLFNFRENLTECTLFHGPPGSYQHSDDCVGYQVIARDVIDGSI